jgi:hypothetical protein
VTTAALRVLGLADDPGSGTISPPVEPALVSLKASRVLSLLLTRLYALWTAGSAWTTPWERRTTAKISARGIYRDPVQGQPRALRESQRSPLVGPCC